MIQPTCEQARRSSLFPTFDVEGAPFDRGPPTSLPRTHEYSESGPPGRRLHQSGTWSFPDLGSWSRWTAFFIGAPRPCPVIYERPARAKARPGRASGVQRAAAFTTIRVGWTSHLSGCELHDVVRPRRLNQMGGRPKEAMTGHERASTTS